MTMKRRNKILTSVGIVVLVAICFYVIFPFFLVGSPLPLYRIVNEDINDHEVFIEVLDPHNKSILKETHNIFPKDSISRPKPFLLKFMWPEGEYIFKITLDGEITETFYTDIDPFLMVEIWLYYEDSNSREVIPIRIGAAAV